MTNDFKERRQLTLQEVSIIRTCVQLLKTFEYSEHLSKEQIVHRVYGAYEDLLECCIGDDEYLQVNLNRLEEIKDGLIVKYFNQRNISMKKIQRE